MTEPDRSEESYWAGGCSWWVWFLTMGLILELITQHSRIANAVVLVGGCVFLCLCLLRWVWNWRQRSRSAGTAPPPAQRDGWYPPVTRRIWRPAASGPGPDRPDVYQRRSSGRRGLDAGGIALAVAAAISFLVGTRIVVHSASDVPYCYSYSIAVFLASSLLGYRLGIPHARSRQPASCVVGGCLTFAGVLFVFVMEELYYGPGGGELTRTVLFVLKAGTFYIVAFALFFRLLHTRWGRKV